MTALLAITLLSLAVAGLALTGLVLAVLAMRTAQRDAADANGVADIERQACRSFEQAAASLKEALVEERRKHRALFLRRNPDAPRRSRRQPETPAPLPENAE